MKTKYIFLYCLLFICNAVTAQKVITGAEQMGRLLPILKGKRVALVVNQTSKVGETHLLDTLLAAHIQLMYLQPIITQYFIDNKSEIWLLFLIAHSKR